MNERRPARNTRYEGPAELIQAGVPENNIFDRRGMPGGLSVADRLTTNYGPEGTGWGIESEQYDADNNIKHALHEPEFRLASEAFSNLLASGRYELDDGTDMTGKVERRARQADTVNVVKYPDAAHYSPDAEESDDAF